MALEITCEPAGRRRDDARHRAAERRRRRPALAALLRADRAGWANALDMLKDYLEHEWLYRVKAIKEARP